jgi:tetratricopeptide (TPR) repeat protein
MRFVFSLTAILAVGSVPLSLCQAQEDSPATADERARVLFENGRYLFENGRYEEAIIAWEEAYELSHRHKLLFNIASAQERLGLSREALDTLYQYRIYAEPDELDALESRLISLKSRIAEESVLATTTQAPSSLAAATPLPSPTRSRGIGLTTGGTLLMGAGVALGLSARNTRRLAEEGCSEGSSGFICTDDVSDLVNRQQRLAMGADAAMLLGLGTTAGGVFFLVDGRF